MMIWINGTFGVGKSTAGMALVDGHPALRKRIENDQLELTGRQWRLDHISQYTAARKWMIAEADLVVDTSCLSEREVVAHIAGAINEKLGVRADG